MQPQYSQGAATSHHPTPYVPPEVSQANGGSSVTSSLRQWRKKDYVEKQQSAEQPPPSTVSENTSHVARVAPHTYYPRPSNDFCHYQHAYQEYSAPYKPPVPPPVPVKYSEIVENQQSQTIEHITSVIPKHKEKEFVELCSVPPQSHLKQYQDHLPIKHQYPDNPKQSYPDSTIPQYIQKEPQVHPFLQKQPDMHQFMQKDPYQQFLPNNNKFNMQSQYSQSYPSENNFLAHLNKINPRMAQSIINDTHLRDSQIPVYHNFDQNRTYPQSQRMYHTSPSSVQSNTSHPHRNISQTYSYPQPYNYNVKSNIPPPPPPNDSYNRIHHFHQPNAPKYISDYKMNEHSTSNVSPQRVYSEGVHMNYAPIPPKISPNYPHCGQLEYAQHYQHRRQIPQEYYPHLGYKSAYVHNSQMPPEENDEESRTRKPSLKQYLETWVEEDISGNLSEIVVCNNLSADQGAENVKGTMCVKNGGAQEQPLYVLDTTEIADENLPHFLHLQQFEKLPDNIRGYYHSTNILPTGNRRIIVENNNNSNDSPNNNEAVTMLSKFPVIFNENCKKEGVLGQIVSVDHQNKITKENLEDKVVQIHIVEEPGAASDIDDASAMLTGTPINSGCNPETVIVQASVNKQNENEVIDTTDSNAKSDLNLNEDSAKSMPDIDEDGKDVSSEDMSELLNATDEQSQLDTFPHIQTICHDQEMLENLKTSEYDENIHSHSEILESNSNNTKEEHSKLETVTEDTKSELSDYGEDFDANSRNTSIETNESISVKDNSTNERHRNVSKKLRASKSSAQLNVEDSLEKATTKNDTVEVEEEEKNCAEITKEQDSFVNNVKDRIEEIPDYNELSGNDYFKDSKKHDEVTDVSKEGEIVNQNVNEKFKYIDEETVEGTKPLNLCVDRNCSNGVIEGTVIIKDTKTDVELQEYKTECPLEEQHLTSKTAIGKIKTSDAHNGMTVTKRRKVKELATKKSKKFKKFFLKLKKLKVKKRKKFRSLMRLNKEGDYLDNKVVELETNQSDDAQVIQDEPEMPVLEDQTNYKENETSVVYQINDNNVVLQIADELLEINITTQNGRKIISVKTFSDTAIVNNLDNNVCPVLENETLVQKENSTNLKAVLENTNNAVTPNNTSEEIYFDLKDITTVETDVYLYREEIVSSSTEMEAASSKETENDTARDEEKIVKAEKTETNVDKISGHSDLKNKQAIIKTKAALKFVDSATNKRNTKIKEELRSLKKSVKTHKQQGSNSKATISSKKPIHHAPKLHKTVKKQPSNGDVKVKNKSVVKKKSNRASKGKDKTNASIKSVTIDRGKLDKKMDDKKVQQEVMNECKEMLREVVKDEPPKQIEEEDNMDVSVQENSITSSTPQDGSCSLKEQNNKLIQQITNEWDEEYDKTVSVSNRRRLSLKEYNNRKRTNSSTDLDPQSCDGSNSELKPKTNDAIENESAKNSSPILSVNFNNKTYSRNSMSSLKTNTAVKTLPTTTKDASANQKSKNEEELLSSTIELQLPIVNRSLPIPTYNKEYLKNALMNDLNKVTAITTSLIKENLQLMQRFLDQQRLTSEELKEVKKIIRYKRLMHHLSRIKISEITSNSVLHNIVYSDRVKSTSNLNVKRTFSNGQSNTNHIANQLETIPAANPLCSDESTVKTPFKRKRKRFRFLYSDDELESSSLTSNKESKLDRNSCLKRICLDNSVPIVDTNVMDYSVHQSNSQGQLTLVFKRSFKNDPKLQPFVKLERLSSIDKLAKNEFY